MTEDDTFRKLRQIPLSKLTTIIGNTGLHYNELSHDFYNEHGWTKDEYYRARRAHLRHRFSLKEDLDDYD